MAKKKINSKALEALQKWRAGLPRDSAGKIIYPKRKTSSEVLAAKKLKLAKLQAEVEKLKAEIAKIDSRINNQKIKDLISKFTFDELIAKLGN